MSWPSKPTCHGGERVLRPINDSLVWRPPRVDQDYGQVADFRTCGYCGSVHPEDLASALELIADRSGVRFQVVSDPGGRRLRYAAPHAGYQR